MQGIFSSDQPNQPAVQATGINGAEAIKATSDRGNAIEAVSSLHAAIVGGTEGGIGVAGHSLGEGIGVRAISRGGAAVNAQSQSGPGVLGASDENFGVVGICTGYSFGVVGTAPNAGVAAFNPNNHNAAYLASDCCAAWFTGSVAVTGRLFKGGGGFLIDHPLEPAEKTLAHSFVESPDMKNVYDGEVVAGPDGTAIVILPEWIEALNDRFRYQLTAMGAPAPELHVAEEIERHRFTIAGARPGMKVCWQVTGIRRDPWAHAYRIPIEEPKPPAERGHYLHPEVHGAPPERAIGQVRHPAPSPPPHVQGPPPKGAPPKGSRKD